MTQVSGDMTSGEMTLGRLDTYLTFISCIAKKQTISQNNVFENFYCKRLQSTQH